MREKASKKQWTSMDFLWTFPGLFSPALGPPGASSRSLLEEVYLERSGKKQLTTYHILLTTFDILPCPLLQAF